ncbi:polyketide cyclase [Parafrankia colletiae]|uniref:Polyketide cyclase n=1 Tax=Parafrankia colletiae TaxID=573497 RepID=A0A1S1QEF4_9ACTN|nr:nuclear transport factor 2 family protein [Parafrankia colletiae]MCK9902703.1 nuclear transport factor 2 family protein [Frankia sp. Cpl3]OHV32360.1 polyketide cyclase [Parafrankia colletiae]
MLLPTPTPTQAADVVAIQHLAASYAEAVSRGALEEATQVYAPDGVLASPTTQDAVGPVAIAALVRATTADLEFVFQTVHLGLVHVDGDAARARFPVTEWARRRSDGRPIQFLGVYEDDLVRLPEGWRFSRRRLIPRIVGRPEGLTGRLIPYSGLQDWDLGQ